MRAEFGADEVALLADREVDRGERLQVGEDLGVGGPLALLGGVLLDVSAAGSVRLVRQPAPSNRALAFCPACTAWTGS